MKKTIETERGIYYKCEGSAITIHIPILQAMRYKGETKVGLKVWCRYCGYWHHHGEGEGHRKAHCAKATPYSKTGYIIRIKDDLRQGDTTTSGVIGRV